MNEPNQIVDLGNGTLEVQILKPYEPLPEKLSEDGKNAMRQGEVSSVTMGAIYVRHLITCDQYSGNEYSAQLISELSGVPMSTILRMHSADFSACATAVAQQLGKSRAAGET